MNQEQQKRNSLRDLIAKGKEQGFLTYAEVNDHLPDNVVDPDQIDDIVRMINDMGIVVHERAPDSSDQTLSDNAVSDDEAAEAAVVALATVDSEFGRTTDPVRMYMREMGTVELLTREDELRIAKRIEQGLYQVGSVVAAFPPAIAQILADYAAVSRQEKKLADVVVGFKLPDIGDTIPMPEVAQPTSDDEEPKDTSIDAEEVKQRMNELDAAYQAWMRASADPEADPTEIRALVADCTQAFMELRWAPLLLHSLNKQLLDVIQQVRAQERLSLIHI